MADEEKEGEKAGGEVLFAGYASWSMVGKVKKTKNFDGVEDQILWGFHRLKPLMGIKISKVVSGPVSCTCVALSADGAAYLWGRNSSGQLGLGHTTNVYNPTKVDIPSDESVVGGACGPTHTLLFTATGSLLACGAGSSGQLGIGKKIEQVKKFTTVGMNCVVTAVSAGREFSMIVDSNGVIYSCGHPEYGCLGNGSENKTLERSNKFAYLCETSPKPILALPKTYGDVKVVDVACGAKHTCAMDSEGRVYTWGFGAYGRLGHKDNKNQMEPMAVELFSFEPPPLRDDVPKFMQHQQPKVRAAKITCGSTSTFVVAGEPYNSLYMFGITKRTGEAVMYPSLVSQVSGWKVRSVSVGNTSVAVASEKSLITWGPSPTFGELGYGEEDVKSSTVSRDVKDLKGCVSLEVASGKASTLVIVDTSQEGAKEKLDKLPVFAPSEVDPSLAAAAAAKVTADRAAKRAAKRAAGDDAEDDEEGEDDDDDDDEDDDDDDAYPEDDDEEEEDEEDESALGKRKNKPAPSKRSRRKR